MGCPKCGGPVGDTDLACRQCGASFIPDAAAVAQGMAYDQAAIQMQQQQQLQQRQQGFGAQQPPFQPSAYNPGTPFDASSANPYAPGGLSPAPYGLPPAGATQGSSDATTALIYAVGGIFCFGFILGFLAMQKAHAAKSTIAQNPGMDGMGVAQAAYYLGLFDILIWAVWFLRMIYASLHMYGH